jgi:vitamin-K-epoxide reductase (warfarin-sensitive)
MRYLILVLALAGVIVSTLALRVHYHTGTEPCDINAKWDCGIVNHSSYSVLYGVPVAAIGMGGYLLIGVLAMMRRKWLMMLATLIGLGFALHLSHVEKDILEVWCLYCVGSQGIIALITLCGAGWLVSSQMAAKKARA